MVRWQVIPRVHNAAANNKYMKTYNNDNKSSYIIYLDTNNLYGWAMSQKLPVDGFEWKKVLLNLMKSLLKNYDENSDIGC